MWFKNLFIFQLTKSDFFKQINLEEQLKNNVFAPCLATELTRSGWVSALQDTENLVHSAKNDEYMMLRRQTETKVLPADFVIREVNKAVKVIETEQARKATKKEREQIKDDVTFKHLPHAFSVYQTTELYIDNHHEILIINTSKRSEAEDILALLRCSIGTLPVTSYFDKHQVQTCLNGWVLGEREVPNALVIGDNIKLSGTGDVKPVATFQNEDVFDERIVSLIKEDGRDIDYLDIAFDACFSMQISDDGAIKKVNFFDVLTEQNDDIDSDDLLARVDADFVLFAGEVSRLIYEFKELELIMKVEKEPFDPSTLSSTLTEVAEEPEGIEA